MPREYSPDSLGDNTGILFASSTGPDLNKWEQELFKAPAWLECKGCDNPTFRVQCDTQSEHVRLVCNNCRLMTRAFRLQAPQLNDEIARRTGLYVAEAVIDL